MEVFVNTSKKNRLRREKENPEFLRLMTRISNF
jgi:hypothetical protein